jgi:hypothetical protein
VDAGCAKAVRSLSRFLTRVTRHRQSRLFMSVNNSKAKVV